MKNPVALSSPYISQFGFTALFDLHLKNITLDISDLTIFKGEGKSFVTSIKFTITDPIGLEYDEQSLNVQTYDPLVIPLSDLIFGAYSIKAKVTYTDGTTSTLLLSKNIIKPENWNKTNVKGVFGITADCRIPSIKISDESNYAYAGGSPVSQTKLGKLTYPDNLIAPMNFTFTPFTVGEKEGIYLGLYKAENLTLSKYNLGDNIYVILPSQSTQEFNVDCDSNLQDILRCITNLYHEYAISKGTAKGIQIKDLLDGIAFDLTIAILKGQTGYDNNEELSKISQALKCDCGCSSTTFLEPGLVLAGSSFSITGDNGAIVTRSMLGNTTRYNISVDIDQLSEAINIDGLLSLLQASIDINSHEISLKVSQIDFDALGDRVSQAETSIIQSAFNISLKASQSSVNALSGRLTSAEASILINANSITSKVSQSTFDALNNRVGQAEASIVINAGAITSKVSQSTFDALNNRVGLAEASILINAGAITSKVSQSTFDALNNRVGLAEASIIINANSITSKVSQSTFDALGNRVSLTETRITQTETAIASIATSTTIDALTARVTNVESLINQQADLISLKVSQSTFDALKTRVSSAEASIVVNANAITSKVSQSTFDALGNRVASAEASIIVNANSITSKISQSTFDALSTIVNGIGNRLTTAESQIVQNANSILLKVSQSTFDALGTRVSSTEASISVQASQIQSKVSSTDYTGATVVSMINQSPATIQISAKNINLAGSVKITDFANSGSGALLTVDGKIKASLIEAMVVTANTFATPGVASITINQNNDGLEKFRHSNGVVGLEIGLVGGELRMVYYDTNGIKKWEAGKDGYKVIDNTVETWNDVTFLAVGQITGNHGWTYTCNALVANSASSYTCKVSNKTGLYQQSGDYSMVPDGYYYYTKTEFMTIQNGRNIATGNCTDGPGTPVLVS